jgi:hypothetical protein
MSDVRTIDDLHRAVRSLAVHFDTDVVVIVGSQSVLLEWPDAPVLMRTSGEIDAYPGNIRDWEAKNPGDLASEEINVLFGWGSQFHDTFGFYIDGVDETTAKLPPDWQARAIMIDVDAHGKRVTALAPCPEDMVCAKLNRLVDKDRAYIEARHRARPLDFGVIRERFRQTEPEREVLIAGLAFLDHLEGRTSSHNYSLDW